MDQILKALFSKRVNSKTKIEATTACDDTFEDQGIHKENYFIALLKG